MTHATVTIQIMPKSIPSTLSWMGEVAAFAQALTHTGILKAIQDQVRFARTRFGSYDLIDFVAVLIGRKRGEVVRTRTVIYLSQVWPGSVKLPPKRADLGAGDPQHGVGVWQRHIAFAAQWRVTCTLTHIYPTVSSRLALCSTLRGKSVMGANVELGRVRSRGPAQMNCYKKARRLEQTHPA